MNPQRNSVRIEAGATPTEEQITQLRTIDPGNPAITPNVQPPPQIDTGTLTKSPAPLKLAPKKIPTAAAGVMGIVDATTAQAQDNIKGIVDQTAITEGKEVNKTLFNRITDFISKKQGQTALTDEAYSATVDPAKKELMEINNQINTKQLAYRRRKEAIQSNTQGFEAPAVQSELARVEREEAQELADLSIIAQAKQNNYFGAKEIADRKVAMQLEEQKNEFEALQFFYNENKDQLSKKEDQQFQLLLSERKRLLDNEENQKKAINDLALEALKAGAPTSVAQKAMATGSIDEALGLVGSFLRPKPALPGAPTIKSINGVDMQWNPQTGAWETIEISGSANSAVTQPLLTKLDNINQLLGNNAISSAVGTSFLTRTPSSFWGKIAKVVTTGALGSAKDLKQNMTGERQDFISGVKNLVSQETLNSLLALKKAGGTLGALSDTERVMLQNAATKIGGWEVVKDGNVVGYNASEKSFKAELQRIKELTEKALKEAGIYTNISDTDIQEVNSLMGDTTTSTPVFNPANFY